MSIWIVSFRLTIFVITMISLTDILRSYLRLPIKKGVQNRRFWCSLATSAPSRISPAGNGACILMTERGVSRVEQILSHQQCKYRILSAHESPRALVVASDGLVPSEVTAFAIAAWSATNECTVALQGGKGFIKLRGFRPKGEFPALCLYPPLAQSFYICIVM